MVVPQLVSSIAETLRIAEQRLRAASAVPAGQEFLFDGQTWRVAPNTHTGGYIRTQLFVVSPDGAQHDLTAEEDAAFWTWAVVEVLRHSGIRIEEMLELTHLSIRAFRKPDGQVVPLIQIAPSKTNMERILPASPQLTHALSRIVARQLAHQRTAPVDNRGPMLPLVSRRGCQYELTYSTPLPFLFQRRLGSGRRTVMSGAFVRNRLDQAAVTATGRHRRHPDPVHPTRLSAPVPHRRRDQRAAHPHRRPAGRTRQHQHHPRLRRHLPD